MNRIALYQIISHYMILDYIAVYYIIIQYYCINSKCLLQHKSRNKAKTIRGKGNKYLTLNAATKFKANFDGKSMKKKLKK